MFLNEIKLISNTELFRYTDSLFKEDLPYLNKRYLPFPPSYGVICVTNECKSSILEISLNDIKLILECISTEKFKISRVERRSTSIFFLLNCSLIFALSSTILYLYFQKCLFLKYVLHSAWKLQCPYKNTIVWNNLTIAIKGIKGFFVENAFSALPFRVNFLITLSHACNLF